MESKQYNEFRLQELITLREGMIAENKQREYLGQAMAFTQDNFEILANQIRDLAERR